MTNSGTLPLDDAPEQAHHIAQAGNQACALSSTGAADDGPRSRFGAAASIFDSLDTRPQQLRLARRPWWKLW